MVFRARGKLGQNGNTQVFREISQKSQCFRPYELAGCTLVRCYGNGWMSWTDGRGLAMRGLEFFGGNSWILLIPVACILAYSIIAASTLVLLVLSSDQSHFHLHQLEPARKRNRAGLMKTLKPMALWPCCAQIAKEPEHLKNQTTRVLVRNTQHAGVDVTEIRLKFKWIRVELKRLIGKLEIRVENPVLILQLTYSETMRINNRSRPSSILGLSGFNWSDQV